MADLQLIYTTWPDSDTAKACAEKLLGDMLIACANIFPGGKSVYRWKGVVQLDDETVMILKTRPELWDAVSESLKTLHPYDVPCIIALNPSSASSEFTDWVASQTR